MVGVAHRHDNEFASNRSESWALLVELSNAHAQLIAEMQNLDSLTLRPQPDLSDVATGRWRIGQASLRRRTISSKVFDFLVSRLEQSDLARLKEAQLADQDMIRRSARHIGDWTAKSIGDDWQGYCAASRDIRMKMKAHILLEKQCFYPLLERLAERRI